MDSSLDLNKNTRFGTRSRNMFFVRHTAAPRHLKTLIGIDGIHVCSTKENEYKLPADIRNKIDAMFKIPVNRSITDHEANKPEYITDSKYTLKFNTEYNQSLLKNYSNYIKPKRLKERVFPPIQHYTATYSLSVDTKNWQLELNNLGKMIGIMTADEIKAETNRLAEMRKSEFAESNHNQRPFSSSTRQSVADRNSLETSTNKKFEKKTETGSQQQQPQSKRFNETRKYTSNRHHFSSSFNSSSKSSFLSRGTHDKSLILCDEQSDREVWLLKILSQILETESLLDVQTWLVSANLEEKNAMKELIKKALEGLSASGRIDLNQIIANPNDKQTQVDSQVDFEIVNKSINRLAQNSKNLQKLLIDIEINKNENQAVSSNLNKKEDFENIQNMILHNPKISAGFLNLINSSRAITNVKNATDFNHHMDNESKDENSVKNTSQHSFKSEINPNKVSEVLTLD